jgi:hypothetical protein
VGGDEHGHALVGEPLYDAQDLGDELRVERARHLVEEHQARTHRERAHDRDALLLAARDAVGVLVPLVEQPEALEQLEGAPFGTFTVHPQDLARGEGDVL